jgi:CelD/BcsL family acetyltransferase involved in cellulose biosynthesis
VTIPTLDAEPPCPEAAEAAVSAAENRFRRSAVGRERDRGALRVRQVSFDSIDRDTWDALVGRSPAATTFSRWAFHRAWWDGYGSSAHDQTLVIERPGADPGDQPVAIVPLMHRHEVEPGDDEVRSTIRHGRDLELTPVAPTAKAVFFAASYHADYATILSAAADLPAVVRATVAHLAGPRDGGDRHAAPWDVVDLRRLRCADPATDIIAMAFADAAPGEGWRVIREQEDVCPVVTLPAGVDFQGYLHTLGKKTRHEIRRKLRRAEAAGPVEFVEATEPLTELDAFVDLHQRRWGAAGLFPPTPGGDSSRTFLRRLFEEFGPDGPVRLSFLSVGGRRIAAGIHLDDGRSIAYYNAGIDREARDLSPGIVMVAKLIELAIALGRQRVDFLRGDEPYKYQWGASDEPIHRILVYREGM